MVVILARSLVSALGVVLSTTAIADVPQKERDSIDQIIGIRGDYAANDGVYRVILPREAATIVRDYQTLSPNLGLNSWAAFKAAAHQEAIFTGQFLLLDDEVNSVLTKALDRGLEVIGLASATVFDGRHVQSLDVAGIGTFQNLAIAFRECLDEIQHVRRANLRPKPARPEAHLLSSIDADPLDAILSTKGLVLGGVYKAAIGTRALLHGEEIGREMGMSTWISFSGTNDHAVTHGDIATHVDDLQRVLKALRAKRISIASIRNHTVGEHPQIVFVHFWAQGKAVELARAVRFVLDVQAGQDPA